MRDGVDAVKAALRELETCGYLRRERQRRPDGTMGPVTYHITDQPSPDNGVPNPAAACRPLPRPRDTHTVPQPRGTRRSAPQVDFPPLENPPHKKTKEKKTTFLPSVPPARVTTDRPGGGTEGRTHRPRTPTTAKTRRSETVATTPGVELLLQIGASDPRFLLTGPALRDQGAIVGGLLGAGWSPQQIRHIVAGRPLPEIIITSVGAIIARRLAQAAAGPVPTAAGSLPWRHSGSAGRTWTPPPVSQVLTAAPPMVECDGLDGLCGRPAKAGHQLCAACLNRPPHNRHRVRLSSSDGRDQVVRS